MGTSLYKPTSQFAFFILHLEPPRRARRERILGSLAPFRSLRQATSYALCWWSLNPELRTPTPATQTSMARAISQYLYDLTKGIGEGWNRFWYVPRDPMTLGVLRFCTGMMALYLHVSFSFDLVRLFGDGGLLPEHRAQKEGQRRHVNQRRKSHHQQID